MKPKDTNDASQQKPSTTNESSAASPTETAPTSVVPFTSRPPVQITSCRIVKPLTPPLIAMAHEGDLLFEAADEPRIMQLPVKGRSETLQDANVLDGYKLETGEYCTLVLNVMMASALARAGAPLKGRTFAFRNMDFIADKAYRHIEVVEVEVETAPVPVE